MQSRSGRDARPASWMPIWVAVCVIIAAVGIVFGRTLLNGFVDWDDGGNIFANPFLKPPTWRSVAYFWTHPFQELYIPLIYTSFVWDTWIGGGAAWAYHLGNVVFHAGSALVVLRIIVMLFPDSLKATRLTPWAVMATLVFALHPIQVEAVAWATGRKDVLSGFLSLAAIWQYMEFRKTQDRRAATHYALATLCYLLSLLGKPAAVATPLAALAIDYFALQTRPRSSAAALSPWVAVAAVFVVITSNVQRLPRELMVQLPPAWTRPFVACDALLFYLGKILVPLGLTSVYDRTPAVVAGSAWMYITPLVVAGLAFAAFRRKNIWATAAGIFVAFILPVSGLMPFQYQKYSTVADRYVYVAMAGIALAAMALLGQAASRWRRGTLVTALLVLATLSALSIRQAGYWKDSEALWQHTLSVKPDSATAHTNLATLYLKTRREPAAMEHYKRAVEVDPRSSIAQFGLGLAMLRAGHAEEAIAHFKQSLDADPDYADAHANLGDAYARKNDWNDAIDEYKRAVALKPSHFQARVNLAAAYSDTGRQPEAETELRAILDLNPKSEIALVNLGAVLARQGRQTEAAEQYRKALEVNPACKAARDYLNAVTK